MKEYRIKQAAVLFRQTQAAIAEIANKVGYENQSKFATVYPVYSENSTGGISKAEQ